MATLKELPPAWCREWIGIPFRDRGRSRDGVDCWGLVRLVHADRLGVYLPLLPDGYAALGDPDGTTQVFKSERARQGAWQVTPQPRLLDVAVFCSGGVWHVGMHIARGQIMHAWSPAGSVCIQPLDQMRPMRWVESLRYAAPVEIVGRTRPFASETIDCTRPEGECINEMLAGAGVVPSPSLRVYVGTREVPYNRWGNVRPRAGRRVTVAAVPAGGEGGGNKGLQIVLTLAILVAAVYTGGAAAPALAGVGASAAAVATWGAVVTSAIGLVGALAVSALIPPPRPRLSEGSGPQTSRSITGARNEVKPFSPVPSILGYHRVVPMHGALPYTEISGDDQYLRLLYVIGTGPLALSDHRIGDTVLDGFEDVEIEVRSGHIDDDPMRLYPGTVLEDSESVLLTAEASWVMRTLVGDADEISIDVTWPQGLARLNNNGSKSSRTVALDVEFSRTGVNDWQTINGTSPADAKTMDMLFRTPGVTRLGIREDYLPRIAWGGAFPDAKPSVLPATRYSAKMHGYIYAPVAGEYTIGLDASDAADVSINGRIVIAWYGSHTTAGAPDFAAHAAPVQLRKGWHPIVVRMEARSTAGAVALGWKIPGDVVFSIVPATNLRIGAEGSADGIKDLELRWYDTLPFSGAIVARSDKTDQIRRSLSWGVARGRYDIRLRRVTPDSTSDRIIDKVFLTATRSINSNEPIALAGTARVAMRIKATDQFSGTIDSYNLMARSIVNDWDAPSQSWIERASNNPASLIRHVAQGAANRRPIPDSKLRLPALQDLAEACTAKGITYNAVIDTQGTVIERMQDIAAIAKASITRVDGQLSVVRDMARSVPVQHFTPANSSGFRGRRAYVDLPHGLRISFLNAAKNYERDERIVLDDGYTYKGLDAFGVVRPELPGASVFETLEFAGCTDADLAWKLGRYTIATGRLRPELYELTVDFEHLVASRNDLVLVTHDVPMWGAGSGRIVRLITDTDNNVVGVHLDNAVTVEPALNYVLRCRLASGVSDVRTLVNTPGQTTELMFASPINATDPHPAADDLWMFGPVGRESVELVIKSIEPAQDLTAKLILVDHAPAVHLAELGTIPPFDPQITVVSNVANRPDAPIIEQIRSDDLVMIRGTDGSLIPRMLISLRQAGGTRPRPTHAQVNLRSLAAPGAAVAAWTRYPLIPIAANTISVGDVEEGVTYELQLRGVTAIGLTSTWTTAQHTIIGKSALPPDISTLTVQTLSDGTRSFAWTILTPPPDLAGALVRYGQSWMMWEEMLPINSEAIATSPIEAILPPQGTWLIGIKAVDTSGNQSAAMVSAMATFGVQRLEGVAIQSDEAELGWPGTKSDCFVAGRVLEANDRVKWDDLTTLAATWAAWPRWNMGPQSPIMYQTLSLDVGAVINFSPDLDTAGTDDLVTQLSTSIDDLVWSDWRDVSTARASVVTARYLRGRVIAKASAAHPVPTITRCVLLVRATSSTHELQDIVTSGLNPEYRLGVGDFRLPVPTGRFALIRSVLLGFNDSGPGYTWTLVDRNPVLGPRVRIYGPTGQPADAVIDAIIRGI